MDVQGVAQLMSTDDSQYLLTRGESLRRSGVLPEPRDNDFYLGELTARGQLFGHDALVTVSGVRHEANAKLDASAAAANWGEIAPLIYSDQRQYRIQNQELRIWSSGEGRIDWLAGASRLASTSNSTGMLEPEAAAAREVLSLSERVEEIAMFGELSIPFADRWHVTPGMRLFRNRIRNASAGEEVDADLLRNSVQTSLTPSFSLDWRSADDARFYYLRYARAIRAGGLNPGSTGGDPRFRADKLSNVDLGFRMQRPGGALALQAVAFATIWQHIQSDYLLPNGLIGTRNAGNGSNFGIEINLRWLLARHWTLEGAVTLQRARLYDAHVVVGHDPRLPVVPDVRLHGAVARSFEHRRMAGHRAHGVRPVRLHAIELRAGAGPAHRCLCHDGRRPGPRARRAGCRAARDQPAGLARRYLLVRQSVFGGQHRSAHTGAAAHGVAVDRLVHAPLTSGYLSRDRYPVPPSAAICCSISCCRCST